MDNQLDIVRLIKNQVMFEILLKIKLTDLERFFLKNSNKFVLKSYNQGNEHSTDSSDPDLNIPANEKS